MEINGREIKFRRTVLGNCEIADLCPDKDINKFWDLMKGDYITSQNAAASFMAALSKGYEMAREYEHPGYKGHPLTKEEALLMDNVAFNDLFSEALEAFLADGKATVEAEEPKGKKKENPGLSG